MDLMCSVFTVLLFAALVPGVLVRLPPGGSKNTVLAVHAVLFVVVLHVVMNMYWSMHEHMGNYGELCPNGYTKVGDDCIAVGHKTY